LRAVSPKLLFFFWKDNIYVYVRRHHHLSFFQESNNKSLETIVHKVFLETRQGTLAIWHIYLLLKIS
jgi:hypothetical protein